MSAEPRPPRDGLVRAREGVELRDSSEDGLPTLTGHFAVFDEWTEINSSFEGNFLERIAPGAFTKTFSEQRDEIRALFQHGHDPQIGDKPLGPVEALEEDERGARYEVPLLDTTYNRELLPGLKAGLYGASFRFRVVKENVDRKPERSEQNPDGIPERTVQEAQVYEFGPVTFPAYPAATAGVRSMTDEYIFEEFVKDPERLHQLLGHLLERRHGDDESPEQEESSTQALPEDEPAPATPPSSRKDTNRPSLDAGPNPKKEWQLP